ncbi:MAG: putative toxin-antitoxin system toxin component, PIN family [Cytophagaceae bacterium]|nr:putative toxin-antitoxin system toxin component, PIN family [Cytophagaceae bacterium]MBL0301375.1 putative toxin-antitoxin system toxin component, PIN family [Cytophagaceae bacterium]MBL0324194.1 putative toxin-antitoxin system toxin component, PIN family [Cytophagaceae bacterium]
MKKVVIDTNVFLVSISSKSKYHWLFEAILNENFFLCVTTEILDEYAEIIEQKMGYEAGETAMALILSLPNVIFINSFFRFNLLKDPDDNKFVDCAIAANADFLLTHDSDFNILKSIEFPKVKVIDTNQFRIELFNS